MALGRISGPLLKSNLLRNGVDLAFETDLLYLNVSKPGDTNPRVGINTSTPQYDLDVNGTIRGIGITVTNSATIGDITISGNTISADNPVLQLGTNDTVVYQNKLNVDSIDIEGNVISTNNYDSTADVDLEIRPTGNGTVQIFSDTRVEGNIHATGNITADGNITLGDADTDNVVFNAEVNSDIIPDVSNTYNLGSNPATNGKRWQDTWTTNLYATVVNTDNIQVDGIDLALRQGNIYYVAENGDDTYTGNHPNDPFATLEQALSAAATDIGNGDPAPTIHIYPGNYQETFPLTVPAGVTIKGHSLRSVNILPTLATQTNDAFLLNGEVTIEDLTVKNFYYNSINDTGYAFKLANSFKVTTRSPYIKNVSVITQGSTVAFGSNPANDPRGFDAGDAGKGAFIDGRLAHVDSKEVSVLFHAVTFITPGVDCITLTNGVRVEWLNSFTYFANRSIYAYDGLSGVKNNGKTYITLGGVSGTFTSANTITFTSTDGSTVYQETIDSVRTLSNGDVVIGIDGSFASLLGFDTTPQSITDGTASATTILNIDLKDFGAEVRLIGSASVYGNYGLYGDGPGVIMYAIGHNMAYIGTGKETTNDPNSVIQSQEVTEINDAKVRYNSVDHKGDFRVGDLFHVDQETGSVTFSSSDVNIATENGVSITTNGSTTTLTGERIDTGNLRISGNTISSLSGDINLVAASGVVNVDSTAALNLPKGTTAERPTPVTGMIRYNTDTNLYEGYDGNWFALNGVYDLDLDSYITAELTPGANDNVIRFYSAGSLVADIDGTRLRSDRIEIDDISIDDNVIETITTNTDLVLDANGTGSVVIDELAFKDNTIINRTVDGITLLGNTGNGYVKIEGSDGFVVPSGVDAERPGFGFRETGMIRWNTQQNFLEVFDGTTWGSVAGQAAGISVARAEELALEYVLVLG
jgi:hypothetical protein